MKKIIAAALMCTAAIAASPGAAAAATAEPSCVDEAWADYNHCLVEKCRLARWVCDIQFQIDAIECAQEIIG